MLCALNGVVLAVGLVAAMLLSVLGGRTGAGRLGETTSVVCPHFRSIRDVFIWFDYGDDWFLNRGYLKLGQIRCSGYLAGPFTVCNLLIGWRFVRTIQRTRRICFSRGIIDIDGALMFLLPSSLSYLTHRERISSWFSILRQL